MEDKMDGCEVNFFEKLPEEVLQLIFVAIQDCKTLVQCMVVSKIFQDHASKVNALKISLPKQFPTYDQKLCNICSMIKTFKALESLIVCVGQPKKEPPASWARCMRYAEIGVAVEKFVFMAAKSGDFVEFDSSFGLRSQFIDDNSCRKNINKDTLNNIYKDEIFKNEVELKVDPGLLVNNEIAFFSEEDENISMNHMSVGSSISRKEQGSGLYTIRTIDPNRFSESTLKPQLNVEEISNMGPTLHKESILGYEKGESSDGFNTHNPLEGQTSFNSKTLKQSNHLQTNQKTLHIPTINFHLKQVIAPSNDVLKRMVPVIVFAIVQGLDEFCDSVPNFIEKFVNLKRLVLVDIVESLTIYMREHQIQQVRTLRLETISRIISERVTTKINVKINHDSEKHETEKKKVANKTIKQTIQFNQSNEAKHVDEKSHSNADKNKQDWNEGGDFNHNPLKLQILEIKSKNLSPKLQNKPSMFENSHRKEEVCQTRFKPNDNQTSQSCKRIIKFPISNNICNVCQDLKLQGKHFGICWHRFPNGFLSSIPPINPIESRILGCDLTLLPQIERLKGNWSCDDPSLGAWLKGKQSLAGPEDTSQELKKKVDEIEHIHKENNKLIDCKHIRTFEEIMACRLRDDLSKKFLVTPIISNTKAITKRPLNQILMNSHVTFSNNHEFMPIKKRIDQITPRPSTSIMKKLESSISSQTSKKIGEHINEVIKIETLKLDPWEKPPSSKDSSRSSLTSLNSLKFENLSTKYEVHRNSTPQTKPYGKKKTSIKKIKCLDDSSSNSKICQLKYKSNNRKHKSLKKSNTNPIGKHAFNKGLQRQTIKRCEGERASRITNSRRHNNKHQSKNNVWLEDVWTTKDNRENIPLLECGEDNPNEFWNFTKKSSSCGYEDKFIDNTHYLQKVEDVKGKNVVAQCSNFEQTTSSNETPLETYNHVVNYNKKESLDNSNNDIPIFTQLHTSEQFPSNASNHDEHLNSTSFNGVILVPCESNSSIVNNQLQGLCELEDTNLQSQIPYHDTNFINMESCPTTSLSPSLSPRDDLLLNDVAWIGARAKERSGTRRLGRQSRTRSMRRDNHSCVEREREARRERLREGIQKRQRDIEQEALFFDISFWRSEQVVTQKYILSEVSMCIATHDAKPLTTEELEMLSKYALAGPLLAATITYVNEQIGSHNL